MNNSVMKCCICNNEKSGEFITINDKKYHLCCIEQLQKQYIDLKEHYNNMFECHCNRVQVEKLQNNWNELKNFIGKELDRLARECSQIYEDSLGKTRLLNKDIFNEVKNISNKMQEMEGNNEIINE